MKTVNTLEVDRQLSASVAASIQCTLSDLQPCIQLISLETRVSDNSTKEVILQTVWQIKTVSNTNREKGLCINRGKEELKRQKLPHFSEHYVWYMSKVM